MFGRYVNSLYNLKFCQLNLVHSFFFIRIYFIRILRLYLRNFKNILRIKPRLRF